MKKTILVALIAALGFSAYVVSAYASTTTSTSASPTKVVIPTDWKKFKSVTYGFEFRFPPRFQVSKNPIKNGCVTELKPGLVVPCKELFSSHQLVVTVVNHKLDDVAINQFNKKEYQNYKKSAVVIGGRPGFQHSYLRENLNNNIAQVSINNMLHLKVANSYSSVPNFNNNGVTGQISKDEWKKILSSFRLEKR